MALMRHREASRPGLFEEGWPLLAFPSWSRLGDIFEGTAAGQLIKVEEFTEGDTLVVRAELPGIDPQRDVELTVEQGVLHLRAERSEQSEQQERTFHRRELRYGSFVRSIALPQGCDESSVSASYRDGILEVRVPMPPAAKAEARKVDVTRS